MVDRNDPLVGVHVTHCCVYHGCKYGDSDCPVESRLVKQDDICEHCEEDDIETVAQALAQTDGAPSHAFLMQLQQIAAERGVNKEVKKFIKGLFREADIEYVL